MRDEVASPCCGICHIDEPTQLCEGCLRSLDEIIHWSTMDTAQKRTVLEACQKRQGPDSRPQSLNSGGGIDTGQP